MSHTKFQHLMCVGSYDPLPSTFGPAIKTVKAKEPEVTVKDGFTRVDGKVVSYDPFKDRKRCVELVKAASDKVVSEGRGFYYRMSLNTLRDDSVEHYFSIDISKSKLKDFAQHPLSGDALYLHQSKKRSRNIANINELELGIDKAAEKFIKNSVFGAYAPKHCLLESDARLPGGYQLDELAQHSVAGLDPSGKLSFPVEQPAGTSGLDLKLHKCLCRNIATEALLSRSKHIGGIVSHGIIFLQRALFKDLISEIDVYLSSRVTKASDEQPEEESIISALTQATVNGAASDREAFLKELAEEPNSSLLQEIHKQESARVAELVSAYANIWISESAINDRRHVNWRDKCERGGMQITSVGRSDELFHSVLEKP